METVGMVKSTRNMKNGCWFWGPKYILICLFCSFLLYNNAKEQWNAFPESIKTNLDENTREENLSNFIKNYKCVHFIVVFPAYYHTEMVHSFAWCSGTPGWVKRPSPAQFPICFCYVHLEIVECSMFGSITGALVVQNKPSLLLLAQAYSILCVHVLVFMCAYLC